MGVSTDALLLYGLNLGEDLEPLAKLLDVPIPDNDSGSVDDYLSESDFEDYLPKGVELVLVGHIDGCRDYILAASGYLTARRGYERALTKLPMPPTSVIVAIKKLGKSLKLSPSFWLASYSDF